MQHEPQAGNANQNEDDDQAYDEREAVAIFNNEESLTAAVDELMQIGFRQKDMSLLADAKAISSSRSRSATTLEDKDNVAHANYVSPDARTEGLAAIVGLPVYVAGAGAAALVAAGGIALIPTIAVVAGGGLAASAVGLILARAFGHHHAARVQQEIVNGGLLLWVHTPDKARDADVVKILKRHGGRDVHFHTVRRTWGLADIPLHDANPDPLIKG